MTAEIGIIGGSGLYSMPGFEAQEEAVIQTPFGGTKAEVRTMYIWLEELTPVMTIIRMGRGLMMGVDHGLFCVGCCWTLMLLMVAVGLGSFGWMLILGAVMAIEKNVPWGNRLSAPLGIGLIAWGSVALWIA